MSLKVWHQQLITTFSSYILKDRKIMHSSLTNLLRIVKLGKNPQHHYNPYPFFILLPDPSHLGHDQEILRSRSYTHILPCLLTLSQNI